MRMRKLIYLIILLSFSITVWAQDEEGFLKREFIHALSQADKAYLLPIFASAREQKSASISSESLARSAHAEGIHFIKSFASEKELLHTLREDIKPGDIIFTMGAGDVYKLEDKIISLIAQ